MIQSGVSTSRRWERVGSKTQNCRGQEGAWGRAALCGVLCQPRSKVNLKRERANHQAPSGDLTFIVTQRGSFLSGVVLWERVAPPNNPAMFFWKVSDSVTDLSKRPANDRTRSLGALSQDIACAGSPALYQQRRFSVRPGETTCLPRHSVNSTLQWTLPWILGLISPGIAMESRSSNVSVHCIYQCSASGEDTVHESFLFSPLSSSPSLTPETLASILSRMLL